MRSSLRRFEVEPEDADDALILRDPSADGGARSSLFAQRGTLRIAGTVVAVLSVVVAASALAAFFASRHSGGGGGAPASSGGPHPTLAPDQMPRPAGVPGRTPSRAAAAGARRALQARWHRAGWGQASQPKGSTTGAVRAPAATAATRTCSGCPPPGTSWLLLRRGRAGVLRARLCWQGRAVRPPSAERAAPIWRARPRSRSTCRALAGSWRGNGGGSGGARRFSCPAGRHKRPLAPRERSRAPCTAASARARSRRRSARRARRKRRGGGEACVRATSHSARRAAASALAHAG